MLQFPLACKCPRFSIGEHFDSLLFKLKYLVFLLVVSKVKISDQLEVVTSNFN